MFGEFLREVASLVFIFVPLERWHDPSISHPTLLELAAGAAIATFVIGACFEYVALVAYRFKRDLGGSRENS
jgi:hypothetical protein